MEDQVRVVERVVRLGDAAVRVQSSEKPSRNEHPVFILIHGIGRSHRYLSRLHASNRQKRDAYLRNSFLDRYVPDIASRLTTKRTS